MKRVSGRRNRTSSETTSKPSETTNTPSETTDNRVSRRRVLQVGTLGAAAAGLVASAPNFTGLLMGTSEDAPALTGAATDAATSAATISPAVDGPIIAHITDVSAGNVSLYLGDQAYTFQDRGLVQQLLRQTTR